MQFRSDTRTNKEIQKEVTKNYLTLADFIVRKTGPVKNYGQFAELTGFGANNFSELTKGNREIPLECAVRACVVFGCSLSFMFTSTGEMFGKEEIARQMLDLEERMTRVELKLGMRKKAR